MEIEITTRNSDISAAAKSYAREKLTRVGRFFDRISQLHIQLESGKDSSRVHVVAHLDTGATLVADETHAELRAAIDLCSDKLERRVRKEKQRLIGRNRKGAPDAGQPDEEADEREPSYDEVIRDDLEKN